MGPYLDNFKVGQDIIVFFDTNDKNGAAIDPNITAANIKVYKDGNAGTELSVDADEYTESFDSLDGINKIVLDVSDHLIFYTVGSDFSVVLSTATIDGETVRAILATFSIENRFSGLNEVLSMQDTLDVLLRTILDSTLMTATTVASLSSQTSFTLSAGSTDDDAYNECMIVLKSVSVPARKAIGFISDYTGSSKTVTLSVDPGVFTLEVGDEVFVIALQEKSIVDIEKLLRADKVIDTSASPWVVDYKEEGTENIIMSKTMKNTDGDNIATENNVLGKLEKE
ncbi:hypothetical protein LCGC14_0849310 [marine sediment metagenome]|uniref:Uncharacterized protein n=1 Tax=marine sediment metagenome TaxID=412755 RepID=A0A0F9SHW5_9ZZZZ